MNIVLIIAISYSMVQINNSFQELSNRELYEIMPINNDDNPFNDVVIDYSTTDVQQLINILYHFMNVILCFNIMIIIYFNALIDKYIKKIETKNN